MNLLVISASVFLIQITSQFVSAHVLGDECSSDWECKDNINGSICYRGRCSCQPFYARVNQTTCLQSTLLGYDCLVPEQCSLKVANSSCLDGACRCVDGFLQFRKHTCLGPARPGNVCYSNAHCRLWTADSHCDFLIPNLFGRCQCNTPFKQMGDVCVRSAFPASQTETSNGTSLSSTSTNAMPSVTPSTSNSPTPKTTSTTTTMATRKPSRSAVRRTRRPTSTTTTTSSTTTDSSNIESNVIVDYTEYPPSWLKVTTKATEGTSKKTTVVTTKLPNITNATSTPLDITTRMAISSRLTTMEPLSTAMPELMITHITTTVPPTTTGIRTRVDNADEAISLGLPCVTDLQCRIADPYSRCKEGICDCVIKTNETKACSARNRGCIPGTFQCRSTGTCISWFFVCDGRKDCSDGSDEECKPHNCPLESFSCKSSGKCVSRSARCDGVKDCFLGEDEANCQALGKKGCPPDTFQCRDGKCLPEYEFCNAIIGCSDGSDEPPHICKGRARRRRTEYCPLRCGNGRCRSSAIACSGKDGCGDGTDESHCSVCRCPVVQGRNL